jgi:hypothetical protein
LDLLIVSDAFRDMGVDMLCYTEEEYDRKRQELDIVRTASEEGIILLGNPVH